MWRMARVTNQHVFLQKLEVWEGLMTMRCLLNQWCRFKCKFPHCFSKASAKRLPAAFSVILSLRHLTENLDEQASCFLLWHKHKGCLSFPLSHFHSTALSVPSLPQMAVLEIQSNGDSSYVSQEAINSAIQSLEDPLQRVRDGTSTRLVKLIFIGSRYLFFFLSFAGVHPEVSGGRPLEAAHSQGASLPPGLVRGALTQAAGCALHRQPPA